MSYTRHDTRCCLNKSRSPISSSCINKYSVTLIPVGLLHIWCNSWLYRMTIQHMEWKIEHMEWRIRLEYYQTSSHVVSGAAASRPHADIPVTWYVSPVYQMCFLSGGGDPHVSLTVGRYRQLNVLMALLMHWYSLVGWPRMHAISMHEVIPAFTPTHPVVHAQLRYDDTHRLTHQMGKS